MAEILTYSDASNDVEILGLLTKCSQYPQSVQRTRSTDELLDRWLEIHE